MEALVEEEEVVEVEVVVVVEPSTSSHRSPPVYENTHNHNKNSCTNMRYSTCTGLAGQCRSECDWSGPSMTEASSHCLKRRSCALLVRLGVVVVLCWLQKTPRVSSNLTRAPLTLLRDTIAG